MPADDDRGASAVEFVLMSVLLVFLLFGVLQVAVYVYARNIVGASAADGARYGADHGVDPRSGGARATNLIGTGLGTAEAARIRCLGAVDTDAVSGLQVSRVRCRGQLKMIFLPIRVPLWIDVTSSALKEGP